MSDGLEIAIIGMAGRFPGARNVRELWSNLERGIESIERLSDEQLREAGVDARMANQPNYVRAHASLRDIDQFDAELFGVTPHEAAALDPQHRVFLECVWEAFESAGYDPEQIRERVGVYAGSSFNGYLFHHFPNGARVQSAEDLSALLSLDKDFLATRVSYKLNLRGPSVAVQTACSTSLVAVHLACQSLLLGECEYALAGGVSINVPQSVGYLYQEDSIASPDGHCRSFDAAARGTVAGSGAGVVLLKRLADARADGDAVLAVIKGSAINNDGRGKAGFTAPSVSGQAKVIRDAHAAAGVEPTTIGYVEAHGTATPLGDPIEVAALSRAFGEVGTGRCALGSLKSNIGHLDAAAGVAGLIKAALALRHRKIPKSLHFESPNPAIDFARSPFFVARETQDFPAWQGPRRAGVSSFGIGGTNAHVVLEEAPDSAGTAQETPQLLLLSARSQEALDAYARSLADRLEEDSAPALSDAAYTLRVGRRGFALRRALLCTSREEAVAVLRAAATSAAPLAHSTRHVAFLFPGQGSQRPHAGRALYGDHPSFRATIDRCAELLSSELGGDLRAVLFPEPHQREEAEAKLARTSWAQPALFVLEYALAAALEEGGVRASAYLGHSVGEYVAATLAGTFTLEDALRIVAARGRLMEATPPGAMLAVSSSEEELAPLLAGGNVALAAVNAARQCVLAGATEAIEVAEAWLAQHGFNGRRLRVARAFHSALMDSALEPFRALLGRASLSAPHGRWISNVSGRLIEPHEATDPDYWVRQLRSCVRFAEGLQTLRAEQTDAGAGVTLLEVGPGETLSRLASAGGPALATLPEGTYEEAWLALSGRLWCAGVPIDTSTLGMPGRRVPLPAAPLERKRYWLEPRAAVGALRHAANDAPAGVADWFYVPSWRRAALTEMATPAADERWLIVADESGSPLAPALRAIGKHVEIAAPAQDFAALLRVLSSRGQTPTHVVHAVAFGKPNRLSDAAALAEALHLGLESLLWLGRALAGSPSTQLLVLAHGLHDVTGSEALLPAFAPLLGAVRTLATEYPALRVRLLDFEHSTLDAQTVRQVVDESLAENPEQVVAYRGVHRWLPTLEQTNWRSAPGLPSRLRARGTYLITGGLGGLGLELAEFFARVAQARLVLVGRSEPNPEQRARLEQLQPLGAELLVCRADVGDPTALRGVIEEARMRFGTIHGAVHAAASGHGGLIAGLTSTDLQQSFHAKASGALALCSALLECQPDFVLLCSSLSALSGGVGQAGYAAANGFLDAFACAEQRAGRPVTSVNFDRFPELGMALEAQPLLASLGLGELALGGVARAQISALLHHLFQNRGAPQLVVSTRALRGLPKDEVGVAFAARLMSAGHEGPIAHVAKEAPLDEVTTRVQAMWAAAFGVSEVAADSDFYALGGESLLALQILNRIRAAFGVEIPLRELFEQRTPRALARAVHGARTQALPPASNEPALVAVPRSARRLERREDKP